MLNLKLWRRGEESVCGEGVEGWGGLGTKTYHVAILEWRREGETNVVDFAKSEWGLVS